MKLTIALSGALAAVVALAVPAAAGGTSPATAVGTGSAATVGTGSATTAEAGVAHWSAPVVLSTCPASSAPRVLFPSDSPEHATGRGAVAWSAATGCPGGQGARVAAVGAGEVPGVGGVPRTASGRQIALRGALTLAGGPYGQVVLEGHSSATDRLVVEGPAGGPFSALTHPEPLGTPLTLASAYLGDVALASPPADQQHRALGLRVRVQRHYTHDFGPDIAAGAGAGAGSVRALTIALDYRSDVLAAWAQGGALYARELPASGAPHPIERLASASGDLRISALLSDDGRGMIAWSEQRRDQTSVLLDRSGSGVRFGSPELLEHFEDPDGLPAPAGSPTLVRLSSESVMMAWAGSAGGHWVVRTAAVDNYGIRTVNTIAAPGADALLEDLAPGPDADALVLWSEAQPSNGAQPALQRRAIFAARGIDAYPGRTIFGPPEEVAPPGPNDDPTVALDPDNDRALAVWRGVGDEIEYSIRGTVPSP